MASLRSTLSLIALLALSLPLLPSLADNLGPIQCHNTETPEICETCVNSSSTPPDTAVAVAATVVSCVRAQFRVLAHNMSDMAKAATNNTVRTNLLWCSRGYAKSVKTLERVEGSYLQHGRYDDANRFIRLTAETQLSCRLGLEMEKVEIPDDVTYSMNVCDDLADGAMRIIDRLPLGI